MKKILRSSVAIGTLLVAACSSTSPTGLTQTGQTAATVACAIDGITQPIGLQFVSGVPTVGGLAATADAAIIHPLVVKACGDLAASIGASPAAAKPVVVPAAPAS